MPKDYTVNSSGTNSQVSAGSRTARSESFEVRRTATDGLFGTGQPLLLKRLWLICLQFQLVPLQVCHP